MTLKKITGFNLGLVVILTFAAFVDIWWLPGTRFWLTTVTTLSTFSFAFLHAGQNLGWRRASLLLVVVFVVSISFESIGVLTGAIYGPYHYTDRLGPKFLGLVPYIIPVAWFMMMYASLAIAEHLIPNHHAALAERRLLVSAVGAMIMTAWDLALDPLMVAGGHWVWEVEGAYFGIPLKNFWGWWLTSFVSLQVFQMLAGLIKRDAPAEDPAPYRWVVFSYLIIGGSTVVINFSIGLPGPGMVGLFAMLPWGLMGLFAKRD